MRRIVPLVLVALALLGRPASASPPSVTLAAGPMFLAGDEEYPLLAHALVGGEWVSDLGVGVAVDGGWLWSGSNLVGGIGTLSPSLLVPLRRGQVGLSLRAGVTLASSGDRLVLGGVVLERKLSRGRRLRVEVRDAVVVGDYRLNAAEVVVGLAFADERR